MRPAHRKRTPPRICDLWSRRIFHVVRVPSSILSNSHEYGPAAVIRVLQMLLDWIIVGLPSTKRSFTQEAYGVIIARAGGFEVEACFGELFASRCFVRPS